MIKTNGTCHKTVRINKLLCILQEYLKYVLIFIFFYWNWNAIMLFTFTHVKNAPEKYSKIWLIEAIEHVILTSMNW